MTPLPTLLTTSEVADLFRVDTSTVVRWADSGKLRAIRTPGGRDLRFDSAEVRSVLDGLAADDADDTRATA